MAPHSGRPPIQYLTYCGPNIFHFPLHSQKFLIILLQPHTQPPLIYFTTHHPHCINMDTSSGQWSKIVFRLRGLPNRITTLDGTAIFLSGTLGDTPTDSIRVFSLATTLSSHERPPSKVATVMFSTVPAMVALGYDKNEWNIPPGEGRLILDTHFNGMTPLNDVPPTDHLHECVT